MNNERTVEILNAALRELYAAHEGGHISHETMVAAVASIWACARHEGLASRLEEMPA